MDRTFNHPLSKFGNKSKIQENTKTENWNNAVKSFTEHYNLVWNLRSSEKRKNNNTYTRNLLSDRLNDTTDWSWIISFYLFFFQGWENAIIFSYLTETHTAQLAEVQWPQRFHVVHERQYQKMKKEKKGDAQQEVMGGLGVKVIAGYDRRVLFSHSTTNSHRTRIQSC